MSTALAWSGQACDCPVSAAVSFGGDAVATAPRATAPRATAPQTPAASSRVAVAGRVGDANAVAVSLTGDATATALSGLGAAGSGAVAGPVVTAVTSAHRRGSASSDDVDRAARSLADGIVDANAAARGLVATHADTALVDVRGVSMDLVTSGDDCSSVGPCTVAVAVSVGGRARAVIGAPPACGTGGGTATSVAVAFAGDADADNGSDAPREQCSAGAVDEGLVAAIAGDTGSALGVSLAGQGSAAASASSGSLGVVASRVSGSPSRTGVIATSGSSGDSTGIAVGKHAASTAVDTGNTGDADASCSRCAPAADGSTRAASGDTGDTFSLSGAGLDAIAASKSGATGDVTATASGSTDDSRTVAQKDYHGGTVTGRSGDTGNAFAGAVDPSSEVEVDTRSGLSGFVTSTTTRPRDPGVSAGDGPGNHGGSVQVGPSGPGSRSIRTGHHRETSIVSPHPGIARTISHTVTHRAETPAPLASASRTADGHERRPAAAIVRLSPVPSKHGTPAQQAAANDHRRPTPSAERGSTAATIGITSGAIFFSLAALLVALVRLRRRGRSRR